MISFVKGEKRRFPLTFRIEGLPAVIFAHLPQPDLLILFGPHSSITCDQTSMCCTKVGQVCVTPYP